MPRIDIINETNVPLHIALKHISPIHYVNNVPPQGGRAVFERVGRVWFTVEARVARQAVGKSSDEPAQQTTEREEQSRRIEAGEAAGTTEGAATPPGTTTTTSRTSATKAKAREWGTSVQNKVAELRESIDPNNTSNEYTLFQSVAAPVAVSVAALSLGAGAVYIGLTASATGSIGAALSSTSAELSAAAMSTVPSARRLMKYASKGRNVAQIGRVLGIGGGALGGTWLGKHDADKAVEQERQGALTAEERRQVALSSAASSSSSSTRPAKTEVANVNPNSAPQKDLFDHLTDRENLERLRNVTKVLKRLVTKPVVSSHGWYMGEDRTIIIRGGPQAAEVEHWLIIETDTVEPFEVVGKRVEGDKDAKEEESTAQEQMRANADDTSSSPASSMGSVTHVSDEQGHIVEKHDPIAKLRKEEAKEKAKSKE